MPRFFACWSGYDCIQDYGHISYPTDQELRCGGEIVTSGEAGAVLATSQPGPYAMESQTLTIIDGTGKAFRQSRSRCLDEDNCPEGYGLAWTLEPLETCEVEIDPAEVAGCDDPEGVCEWTAYGVNCVEAPDSWTCAELP